jgi:hypothetical protein
MIGTGCSGSKHCFVEVLTCALTYLNLANAVRYGTARAEWFLNVVCSFPMNDGVFFTTNVRLSYFPLAKLSKRAVEQGSQLLVSTRQSCSLALKALWA